MAAIDSSDFLYTEPAHQHFRWITGPGKESHYAAFLELAYDLAAGIHTCLDLVHASELQRETNRTAEPAEMAAPAIGAFDAEKLLRLSLASSAMLTQEALRRIEQQNLPAGSMHSETCAEPH